MSKFAEHLREQRRLVILRLLSEQPGYRSNSSILHAGLMTIGVPSSRDDVATDLHWLRDQGLLSLDQATESVAVATITARGQDVASGLATVPGISRPSPR